MKKYTRIFVLAFIMAALLLAGCNSEEPTNAPDATANFIRYENKVLRVAVSYPRDWYMHDDVFPTITSSPQETYPPGEGPERARFIITPLDDIDVEEGTQAVDVLNDIIEIFVIRGELVQEIVTTQINGDEAVIATLSRTGDDGATVTRTSAIIVHQGRYVGVGYTTTSTATAQENFNTALDAILYTVEVSALPEPGVVLVPQNYISYDQPVGGLKFEYPDEWILEEALWPDDYLVITIGSHPEVLNGPDITKGGLVLIDISNRETYGNQTVSGIVRTVAYSVSADRSNEVITPITVNGYEGASAVYPGSVGAGKDLTQTITVLVSGERVIVINTYALVSVQDVFGPIVEHIINSVEVRPVS